MKLAPVVTAASNRVEVPPGGAAMLPMCGVSAANAMKSAGSCMSLLPIVVDGWWLILTNIV